MRGDPADLPSSFHVPPGASPLLAAVLLALEVARSPADLRAWSAEHDHLPALLPPEERSAAAFAHARRLAVLEVEALPNLAQLGAWWRSNQDRLQALPPADLAAVIRAKDTAKASIGRGTPPPAMVRPWHRKEAAPATGRLR